MYSFFIAIHLYSSCDSISAHSLMQSDAALCYS